MQFPGTGGVWTRDPKTGALRPAGADTASALVPDTPPAPPPADEAPAEPPPIPTKPRTKKEA